MFTVFCEHHRQNIYADIGADGNTIDKSAVQRNSSARSQVSVNVLDHLPVIYMATATPKGKREKYICKNELSFYVALYIRQRTALKLKNVKWLETSQSVSERLLLSPVLEALSLFLVSFFRLLHTAFLTTCM